MSRRTIFWSIVAPLMTATAAITGCDSGTDAGNLASVTGESCQGQEICLAVSYVSYKEDGNAIVDQDTALANVRAMNDVWAQCGISFQLEKFESVDPTTYGLAAGAGATNQTEAIRDAFNDGRTLLVVQTGYWGTTKNAWAAMPGSPPYGVVLESTVADYGNIVAHEMGHYLNLDHIDDNSNVMSAIIYPDSSVLSDSQCSEARRTAKEFWSGMLR